MRIYVCKTMTNAKLTFDQLLILIIDCSLCIHILQQLYFRHRTVALSILPVHSLSNLYKKQTNQECKQRSHEAECLGTLRFQEMVVTNLV